MQCQKCGYENMEGAQRCQKCGAPLGQPEQRRTEPPLWFGSRLIGLFAVIAGALAVVGVFLPWVKATPIMSERLETLSATASGWDLMIGSGDVKDGAEPYAIFVFATSILLLLCAAWTFFDPQSKSAWGSTTVAAIMVIAGYVWGWVALSDYVFAGVNAAEVSISHGVGLYLIIGCGAAGVVASLIGRLGAAPEI